MKSLNSVLGRNNSVKVLYNTLAQYLGKLLVLVLTVVTTALITRALGVENYGKYTIIGTFISFALILSDGGLPTIITREASKEPGRLSIYLHTVIIGRVGFSIPFYIAVVSIAWLLYPHDAVIQTGILILGTTILFNAISSTLGVIFQVKLRLDITAVTEVISKVISAGLIIYVLSRGGGVLELVGVSVIASIISLILISVAALKYYTFRWTFDRKLFLGLLATSLPLGLALFINSVYFKVDAVLLSVLKGPYDVGIYGVAYRILEITLIFPSMFAAAAIPILSRHANNKEVFAASLNKAFKFILILFLPITIGGIFTASQLIQLLGGSDFAPAALPLQVLLVAGLITSFNILYGVAIIALNQQTKTLWLNVGSLGLNILLNLIFIPIYGYIAAAILTLVSELFVLTAAAWYLRKRYDYTIGGTRWLKVLASAAIMALVITVTNSMSIFIIVPLAALVYVSSIMLLKAITKQELRELISPTI